MPATMGDRIKAKRKTLHLTQEELANRLGVKKQTVNRYETGMIPNIPPKRLKDLARELGTTPSYLVGYDAERLDDENYSRNLDPIVTSIASNYERLSPEKRQMFNSLVECMFSELLDR